METKIKNSPTTSNSLKAKPRRSTLPNYSAQQKAQAILQVWTERCKASRICQELGINWTTFEQWQQRAIEGMLQALEPRVNLARGQALSPRLRALLQRQQRSADLNKISSRLEQLQQNKVANPQPDTAQAAP